MKCSKVKICERIGPGFLTSVEFLHRKVAWNAEGFSWTHDPKHTPAMAHGFGFNGKKQLVQTKWKVSVAPGSKTVGKGLCDGADGLDEQETQQYRSLLGTAPYFGQDRPETQYATKEAARLMSGPTRAAKRMLKRWCKYYSEAPVLRWSFPYQEMPSEIRAVTDANGAGNWRDCARRRVDGFILGHETWCRPRASLERAMVVAAAVVRRRRGLSSSQAWRAQRGRLGNKDGRFESNDLAFEKNTPSTANGLELMDGGGDSHRGCRGSKSLPCTNLEREEHVRDEWLVLDLCGNGHCDPDGVVKRTVCESHFRRL